LVWLAARIPAGINSDHLTVLALFAMLMAGVSYYAARSTPLALIMVVGWLGVNWFGDSLDGTLARVRRHQRPRYGFYVDHVVDCVGALFLLAGLGASGYMSPLVAAGLLVAYLLVSIEVYLATYCLALFRMSFLGFGPTELRIVLAVGTLALLFHPTAEILGERYRLFDVGGVIAIVGLVVTLIVSVVRNVRALYRAEPLPRPVAEAV
jgi:phosphatidylglycerophosphate synthase